MAATTTTLERLDIIEPSHTPRALSTTSNITQQTHHTEDALNPVTIVPDHAVDIIPDGGLQAWTQIFACAALYFWTNGWLSTWGVLQAAILRSSHLHVSPSTIAFVGSLALASLVGFGLVWMRVIKSLGARVTCLLAALLMGSGTILASVTLDNLGGLFCTAGLLFGVGSCALYTIGNNLPPQWFSSKLGLSNGLVKVGGGIGGTVLPVAVQKTIDEVGLMWTFRIFGLLMLATAMPCGLLLKERGRGPRASSINWSLLRQPSFLLLCLGGAISTFALFVPLFFIPLFSQSIGLPPSTGAGLVAGFGLSSTIGRLVAGHACDKIGPMNTISITLIVNAVSMLAIWPVSSSLAPLVVFAAINGIANGSYFSAFPVALSSLTQPEYVIGAMGLGTSMWTPGYLLGSSIAGILISRTSISESSSIGPYRAAIFYAGGVALVGGMLVCISRIYNDKKILKKL